MEADEQKNNHRILYVSNINAFERKKYEQVFKTLLNYLATFSCFLISVFFRRFKFIFKHF